MMDELEDTQGMNAEELESEGVTAKEPESASLIDANLAAPVSAVAAANLLSADPAADPGPEESEDVNQSI